MTRQQPLPPPPSPAELASARWIKAAASNTSQGCAEVAHIGPWTVVRDTKNPGGPVYCFTPHEWACFLDGARNGEFDRPLQPFVGIRPYRSCRCRAIIVRSHPFTFAPDSGWSDIEGGEDVVGEGRASGGDEPAPGVHGRRIRTIMSSHTPLTSSVPCDEQRGPCLISG